jgi:hypothetical protein
MIEIITKKQIEYEGRIKYVYYKRVIHMSNNRLS